MQGVSDIPLSAEPIEESPRGLTSAELCLRCRLSDDQLKELVDEGVIEPLLLVEGQWRFQAASLPRIHHALRLQRDLGVNGAGAALALELLDELKRLRALLKRHNELE
ncbi:MAG TPA: chaperone modulator CbpM [Gammaproteobacteria bacterium]|nr:chaperone modulator CbpM [Gammaproteobacteria bacterium]